MLLFGTLIIVAAGVFALVAAGSYGLVIRGKTAALSYGRGATWGVLLSMAALWITLMTLFLGRRFEFDYVNNYSATNLDTFFTIAAIWAGQQGSFAIWALWSSIIGVMLIRKTRHFEPYVLMPFMLIMVTLSIFMLIKNPFLPTIDPTTGWMTTPADGKGLNPLLHNFWMIIHPPILFWGYALCAVPFAFAVGAVLRRDYDTWVQRALPWTLGAFALLGLALVLGGYWAYETLGWGGYWAWDPVENSALVPWLTITALLHGMLIQRTHGSLRRTNLLLAMLTYVLVFYATFLTRSGVLANFSVHSFVSEGLRDIMQYTLYVLIAACVYLLARAWKDLPRAPLSDRFFSRDSFMVLGIVSILTIMVIVLIATSMPLISAIPGVGQTLQRWLGGVFELNDGTNMGGQAFTDGRFSMAQSFYGQTIPPLALITLVLITIGPLLGWRDTNMAHMLRALRIPALLGVIAACVGMALGVRNFGPLFYIGLGVFAIGTNILMIVRSTRGGWLRLGGYMAHTGLAVLLIGVVGSSAYAGPEERIVMSQGETVGIYGYDFTFNGWREIRDPDKKGVLDLTVSKDGNSFTALPQLYNNERMGATMQTPAVHSNLLYDLYISPAEYIAETNPNRPIIGRDESVTAGPYVLRFDGFVVDEEAMMKGDSAQVGAKVHVIYDGKESDIVPQVELMASQAQSTDGQRSPEVFTDIPATLPGGHKLSLVTFDPTRKLIMLNVDGLNLPTQPAKAVVTVSTKPMVLFVWLGAALCVLGGLLGLMRRWLEGEVKLFGRMPAPAFFRLLAKRLGAIKLAARA